MKKKIVTGMLLALALCSITACGKNKASSSVSKSTSVVGEQASQTPEASQTVEGSQSAETAVSQTSQTAETAASQTSQTTETAAAQGADTVQAAIALDEDMASVSYVLLARMISDQEGNAAFDAENKTNGETFWKEMNYLVSAYGVNNKRISFDESSKQYTVKKAQLRFYAASLYSGLGKAKKLPEITEGSESVTKSGSKWQFAMNDTTGYDIAVQSCEKLDKSGTYQITAYLVDASSRTSLGEYSAQVKKSPYKGKKSPFHYTIVSLEKMTKMPLETVLVGNTDSNDTTQDAAQTAGTTDTSTTQTAAASDGTASQTPQTTDSGTASYGTVLSMPGTSSAGSTGTTSQTTTATAGTTDATAGAATTGTADTTATAGTDQTVAAAGTTTDTTAASGSNTDTIAGASVTADAAKEIAQNYYGASSADGKAYTYSYEGTTTYQNVPYYNFSVSDGSSTVINILVSGDGARIYKGTNTNGSWTMQ